MHSEGPGVWDILLIFHRLWSFLLVISQEWVGVKGLEEREGGQHHLQILFSVFFDVIICVFACHSVCVLSLIHI